MEDEQLRAVIGKADACELLSAAFVFPGSEIAGGLANGALRADAAACLEDLGASEEEAEAAVAGLRRWMGADAEELGGSMRRIYSRIYLVPGGATPVFPYESPFRHVADGRPGLPALFRTPVTLDVERQMHEAGVAAKDERTTPCDSVAEEFEFLSYLFAKQADALSRGDVDQAAQWTERAEAFLTDHAMKWLPSFMERTCEAAPDSPYADLARYGLAVLDRLRPSPHVC